VLTLQIFSRQIFDHNRDRAFRFIITKMTAHPVQFVNVKSPLIRMQKCDVTHPSGHIYAMKLSHNGRMLATASTNGSVRLWETHNYQLLYELSLPPSLSTVAITPVEDENTETVTKNNVIDEFYFVEFSPNDKIVIVGGKRKDRHEWDPIDDDNKILPCPVILFDLDYIANGDEEEAKNYHLPTKAVTLLNGHTEEVLCIKSVTFNDEFYYVTGSFDGSVIKWKMDKDYKTPILPYSQIMDNVSNVISSLDFVPNTNNKYLIAGADNFIKLYDFENNTLLNSFPTDYGSYCDCLGFVTLLDAEQDPEDPENETFTLISRGVEKLNEETNRKCAFGTFLTLCRTNRQ
jgi:WD40 repeat protein